MTHGYSKQMVDSIVFAGTPSNAAQTLGDLVEGGIVVRLVITRMDAPIGRKGVLTPSPVALKAQELGIEVHKTNSIDEAAVSKIEASGCEVGIIVAYGSILRARALDALKKGWYNLHYSLLPQLRGAAPVQHAILTGLRETGITVFKLDAGIDTGKYLTQVQTRIEPGETAGRLLQRLTSLGTTALLQELPSIFAGTTNEKVQTGTPTSAPKILRNDARLDFTRSAIELEAVVLGCNPEPGAWTTLHAQPFKIHDAYAVETAEKLEPGVLFMHSNKVAVRCGGATALVLNAVQPGGKSVMSAADWRRGNANNVRFE